MKGFKAAAFVQLNDHHNIMNHYHGRRDIYKFARQRPTSFTSFMSSTQSRRRRHHQSSFQIQSTKDNNNNDSDEEEYNNEDNSNGIFLDLDTYLQAEETLLQPDGTLRSNSDGGPLSNEILQNNEAYQSAVMQGLFPPTYSYPDTKLEQDLSDEELLLKSVTDIQNDKSTLTQQQQQMDAEALHQQVFAEEQVYLEQSEDFRKSLSNNIDNENYESPMAKGRREAVEEYNQEILSDLLREIEEMEERAISREEALSRAKSGGSPLNDDAIDVKSSTTEEGIASTGRPAYCSQCGLAVTPDMLLRASYGPQKLLCQACYGVKFRVKDEADVRLARGPTIWEANQISDEKLKKKSGRRRFDKLKMNRIDTSSLFRIPDSRMPNDQEVEDDVNEAVPTRVDDVTEPSSSVSSPTTKKTTKPNTTVESKKPISSGSETSSSDFDKSIHRQRGPATSHLLGSRELEKRKTKQQTDKNLQNSPSPTVKSQQEQEETAIAEEEATVPETDLSTGWIKVEDSTTKRIMYWNKDTGEMRRNID